MNKLLLYVPCLSSCPADLPQVHSGDLQRLEVGDMLIVSDDSTKVPLSKSDPSPLLTLSFAVVVALVTVSVVIIVRAEIARTLSRQSIIGPLHAMWRR